MEPGGFALEESKLTMLMSPSGAKAELSYSEDGIVRLDYRRRHASEEAAPFANKRHAARRLPVEYDAQALVAVARVWIFYGIMMTMSGSKYGPPADAC